MSRTIYPLINYFEPGSERALPVILRCPHGGTIVMASPKGRISFIYRYQKTDGNRGRLLLGHWPEMRPDEARAAVAQFLEQQPPFTGH